MVFGDSFEPYLDDELSHDEDFSPLEEELDHFHLVLRKEALKNIKEDLKEVANWLKKNEKDIKETLGGSKLNEIFSYVDEYTNISSGLELNESELRGKCSYIFSYLNDQVQNVESFDGLAFPFDKVSSALFSDLDNIYDQKGLISLMDSQPKNKVYLGMISLFGKLIYELTSETNITHQEKNIQSKEKIESEYEFKMGPSKLLDEVKILLGDDIENYLVVVSDERGKKFVKINRKPMGRGVQVLFMDTDVYNKTFMEKTSYFLKYFLANLPNGVNRPTAFKEGKKMDSELSDDELILKDFYSLFTESHDGKKYVNYLVEMSAENDDLKKFIPVLAFLVNSSGGMYLNSYLDVKGTFPPEVIPLYPEETQEIQPKINYPTIQNSRGTPNNHENI